MLTFFLINVCIYQKNVVSLHYRNKDNNNLIPKSRKGTKIMKKAMTIEQEMKLWQDRANDEFGTCLKNIEKASMKYFGCEEDEFGIRSTPLSYLITAYSLDGDRKYTARVIIATLTEWDVLEDKKVKRLADKLNAIANA